MADRLDRGRRLARAKARLGAKGALRRQLGIAFAGYALLFGGPPRVGHPLWLLPLWLGWCLVGVIGIACLFSFWARLHLGALWSAGITLREGHRVVRSGPYAIVRHPIYTALIGGLVFWALATSYHAPLVSPLGDLLSR